MEDEKELHTQEERRLLYVAMTRAQNTLFISYARRYGDNIRETKPSKFLEEIHFQENPLINLVQVEESSHHSEAPIVEENRNRTAKK